MRLSITRTTPVYRGPHAGVFVQWDVEAPPPGVELLFTLYRSESPTGVLEEVVRGIAAPHFFDKHVPSQVYEQTLSHTSLQRVVYYSVESNGVISEPRPVGDNLDRITALRRRKMQYDIFLSLRVGDGIPFSLLTRKHWGVRCTLCYDKLTKTVTNSKCTTCFGTGFNGGYAPGYNLLARKDPTNVQTSIVPQGKGEVNQISLTMLDYPRVSTDDVLAELRQDRRYVVRHVTRTELRGVPVHQKLVISELSRDSVEYAIPLPSTTPAEPF